MLEDKVVAPVSLAIRAALAEARTISDNRGQRKASQASPRETSGPEAVTIWPRRLC